MIESRLVPYQTSDLTARSVLVLAPHADDEVFGCGGALARHAAAGVPVRVVVLTDGAHGCVDAASRAAVIATREAESAAAAAVLGYPVPEFWRVPDRGLEYGEPLLARLLTVLRECAADLVYAPSLLEMHPDHRVLAMLAAELVRRAGGDCRIAFYEVGVPLRPNTLLDLTPVLSAKATAMRCFASQLQRQAYDQQVAALNRYRSYTLGPEVLAAEAFWVGSAAALAADPLALFQSEHQRQAALGLPLDVAADWPLVSVIIRSMDRPLLREALDSLALQTWPRLEVLLVNAKGGEHQDYGAFCGRYPLRLINAGGAPLDRAAAANAGLDAAQGEYLAFLDDDDTVDPGHYSTLVAAQRQCGGETVVYAAVRCIDRADAGRQVFHVFADDYSSARLLAGNFIPIHAPLVPAALVRRHGIRFDESLALYEDWDFWLQLDRHAPFRLSTPVTATYFSSGSSGVGLAQLDPVRMQLAGEQLYRKWLERLDAARLQALALLYRQRHGEYGGLQEQIGQLLQAVQDERQTVQDEQLRAQSLQDECDGLRAQLLAGAGEIAHWQRLATYWQEIAEERQAELHGLRQSMIWRLSAPLRALLERLRRPGD